MFRRRLIRILGQEFRSAKDLYRIAPTGSPYPARTHSRQFDRRQYEQEIVLRVDLQREQSLRPRVSFLVLLEKHST